MAEEKASGVAATAQQTVSARAEKEASEPKKFLQRYSLKIAGFLNLLGDVSLLADGVKKRDAYRTTGGALYTLGAVNLARYGDVDKQFVLKDVSQRAAQFVQDTTGDLPVNAELAKYLRQRSTGTLAGADRWLRKSPAQTTLGLYTGGAAAMLGSGIHVYRKEQKPEGLYYGASSLAIKLISLAMPEKSTATDGTDKKSKGLIDEIKGKPLRVFGYGSFVTDLLLGWDGYKQHKRNPGEKGYVLTAFSSVAYLVSDLMMSISHKDPSNSGGRFTESEREKLVGMLAENVLVRPKNEQEQLADQIAHFLAEQSEIGSSETAIRQSLRKRVASMSGRSWAARAEQESTVDLQR